MCNLIEVLSPKRRVFGKKSTLGSGHFGGLMKNDEVLIPFAKTEHNEIFEDKHILSWR